MDERRKDTLRNKFDRKSKLESHGTKVTSDVGLLAYRELNETLGQTTMVNEKFQIKSISQHCMFPLRTITLGINRPEKDNTSFERDIRNFFTNAIGLFAEQGLTSRTHRITLSPLVITSSKESQSANVWIEQVSALCREVGLRWFCVPFQAVKQSMTNVNAIAIDLAGKYKNAFINYIVTENRQLDSQAIFYASSFICAVSQLSDTGFDNFRCGVSFNCKPNGAFFPFTHHTGKNGFSIAVELTPLFVQIIRCSMGKSMEKIRTEIINELLPVLKGIDEISLEIEEATGMTYYGIDASLAPHPEHPDDSVAYIIELLAGNRFGSNGTTFVTSFLTDIIKSLIKRSGIKATGFNGVMYSVLEDAKLGEVNNEPAGLSIDSLLAFSTMCGCGIDMVPIPGDISEKEVASIMFDVAAIAIRLNKSLGVRLLPIPGKAAGEFTDFDHDFLHNTRIWEARYHTYADNFFKLGRSFVYLS